MIFTKTAVV